MNVPLLPDTLPKIMAALLGPTATRPELLNASELTAEEEKIAEPVALIVPELLTALVLAPKKFNPLTFHAPPTALLNVAPATLNDDVPSQTLPDICPELLTMMPPVLVLRVPL